MQQHNTTSLLELEAADYFKLDPAQVHMFNRSYRPNNVCQSKNQDHKVFIQDQNSVNSMDLRINSSLGLHKSGRLSQKSSMKLPKETKQSKCCSKDGFDCRKDPIQTARNRNQSSVNNQSPRMSYDKLTPFKYNIESSTTSTNSLPSVSSSPSVSPTLVCPHTSLDDILACHNDRSKSAHAIGLCAKCQLNPPPNIQSPLSPSLKLSTLEKRPSKSQIGNLRRGLSDHQAYSSSRTRTNQLDRLTSSSQLKLRDDSLDYYLEPSELRRLQMSPTLRHSVEFIQRNPIESGRVLKIFKNGEPFDKPLRISVSRGEFATLNHLLDHINGRQLIHSGARYLFHLDGQLVYSVNELKHGSAYIVSGTRTFDFRANGVIKEQQRKREVAKLGQRQQAASDLLHNRRNSMASTASRSPRPIVSNLEESMDQSGINEEEYKATVKSRKQITSSSNRSDIQHQAYESRFGTRKQTGLSISSQTDELLINSTRSQADVSKSNENLTSEEVIEMKLVRAKSELSALPNKRKKNVTFQDTGRGSSPAIIDDSSSRGTKETSDQSNGEHRDLNRQVSAMIPEPASRETETSEIGIQVSDTIDGFLIDLPLPLPVSREETRTRTNREARGSGKKLTANKQVASTERPRRKFNRKVVTITERQLSLEEMDQLKDLDHGDHHYETQKLHNVTIKLDEGSEVEAEDESADPVEEEDIVVTPKTDETIVIGQPIQGENQNEKAKESQDNSWQYPGGRDSSATPTERPVSQSEASETVHARVTTPTPSLSTAGDNNSLSMSYESPIGSSKADLTRGEPADLPSKQRVPVMGRLCKGLDPPSKNFKLLWVNGFTINDKYPENSISLNSQSEDTRSAQADPLYPNNLQSLREFKPSDRFHNWICHSRLHDELVYPAGSLVILWCRWTNEQRFYSGHTSNVTSITLAAPGRDLAASSQANDASNKVPASIHLWSLTTLNTLFILDGNHFKGQRIYSMKLEFPESEDCSLSIAAKDDRRLFLYLFHLKFNPSEELNSENSTVKSSKKSMSQTTVIKLNKLIQSNQMPLLLTCFSTNQKGQKQQITNDMILSFGRRHFQIWLLDRKQQKFRTLQPESKCSQFIETIVKANCMARLSPSELLLGDSIGNISLVTLCCKAQSSSKSLFGSSADGDKYSIETIVLLKSLREESKEGTKLPQSQDASQPNVSLSITCLTRICSDLFASGDSTSTVRFWKLDRFEQAPGTESIAKTIQSKCTQISCISLPRDLGYICTILSSRFSRSQSIIEFYLVSTSNAILFGSIPIQTSKETSKDVLANSMLSVVYEGHECSVTNLVADGQSRKDPTNAGMETRVGESIHRYYFTCSLDSKICKWNGKDLVWKSMLPSSCKSLAIHPIGFVLAVGSIDGTVYILDKISGLLISYFPLTPVCINCLAYSYDGALLAAGCANGSIFILPVSERGLKYKKVSIFQSPHPVVSLQFSLDNKFILTSVINDSYQELILWDLPNFRYMRDNVKLAADKIDWFDSTCSGSEDVRAIWENANLSRGSNEDIPPTMNSSRLSTTASQAQSNIKTIINLSCHRLIMNDAKDQGNFAVATDTHGYLRLFRYPCYNIDQGFYEFRLSSSPVNCCRFLGSSKDESEGIMFVSSSFDGSICLWSLE